MSKQVLIKKNEVPEGWSYEAADLINRVLFCLSLAATKKTCKQNRFKRSS